jgi:uncharacterized repeat protein (TIGR01451 family)
MPANTVVLTATMRADILTPFLAYTVIITNSGTGHQGNNPGAEFISPLPPGTTYVPEQSGASAGTLDYDSVNNRILWNGPIPAGQAITISFVLNAGALLAGADTMPFTKWAEQGSLSAPLALLLVGFFLSATVLLCLKKRIQRRRVLLSALLLAITLAGTSCTLLNIRHTIICNQGQVYYDSDGNGTNDSVRLTDDPRMPQAGAPTCL